MLWVASSGLIYDMFSDTENIIEPEDVPYHDAVKWCVGVDYGTANTTVFSLMFTHALKANKKNFATLFFET